MTLTPEDARLLSEVRGWGDRASNSERRLVAMMDELITDLDDMTLKADRERSLHRYYMDSVDAVTKNLYATARENMALSARLALAEACVARVWHAASQHDSDCGCWACDAWDAYDSAKCSPETQAKGTGSGLSPAAKAGEHLQSSEPAPPLATTRSAGAIPHPYICQVCKAPLAGQYVVGIGGGYQHERCPEPAPRLVTLAQAKAWCEEMQANCGRMNERVPLPASLLAALEEEATGTVGSASEVGKASSGESEVRPSPEPPAQVCAHPGVMRRSEWLTSSGGVPARIYCQSCGQTLYPPAATPAVPSGIDPVRDVIGDYRCGVDGCTARCASIAVRCYRHSISHEGVGRLKDGPAPKVIFTRQEVDALLAGLRERCMQAACDGVHRNLGCAEMTGRVRDVNLWPVTEPKRKG